MVTMINFKGVFLNVSESSSEGLVLSDVISVNFMLVFSNIAELDSQDVFVIPLDLKFTIVHNQLPSILWIL